MDPEPARSADATPGGEHDAWVGLGSNLGEREAHLEAALRALDDTDGVRVVAVSPVYETDPVGPGPQGPYLNAAVALRTTLAPRPLLDRLLAIEAECGRVRGAVRHVARTLDLDLLLFGEGGASEISEPDLEVPHPRLHERPFVLEPLRDLAPGLRHPLLGETIDELARRVRDPAAVRRQRP